MSFHRLGLLLALPTVVGLSLAACGTEDDAAPPPASGGTGANGGSDATGGTGETGGTGATGGTINPEGGMGGGEEPGPGGAGGDSAGGASGAGGDGPGNAGDGNSGAGGEGGQAPVACHTILANFDTDPAGNMRTYLTPDGAPVQSSTAEWTSLEGVAAKGAGKLNAAFGAWADQATKPQQAQLGIYFTHANWTCQTKMHAMVKLFSAVDLSHVNGITFNINSGNDTATPRYSLKFISTATWTMDTWYAIEFPFAAADYANPTGTLPDFTDVNAIGVMVQTKPDATPVATTLYVDDVWVE